MSNGIEVPAISFREKLGALYKVVAFRPGFASAIIALSIFAAILEGLGLSFLIPVIEIAQGSTGGEGASSVGRAFIRTYELIGVPFTLETVILGVSFVMIVRYMSRFLVAWLRAAIRTDYVRFLQKEGFENSLFAEISYYDDHGSDEILNAIVTQAEYASNSIRNAVRAVEQGFLSMMYLSVAIYLAPWLTIFTGIILGGVLFGLRKLLESGYAVGGRVADANERLQTAVQAGTQGIREVKTFGLVEELFSDFLDAVNQFAESNIRLQRNKALLDNIYQMATAISVFVLIYVAITFASLPLSTLGVFLFAMFRLAPRISTLNNIIYALEGDLPHLVRTQTFVNELEERTEFDSGTQSPPDEINHVAFQDVDFSYEGETVLDGLSFEAYEGDFVALVGPSGVGKSTIVSLLARMYQPDSGQITASGTPIQKFKLDEWRNKLSIVRQHPYIFNDTLRYNLTVGNRSASDSEILDACDVAAVTEFLDTLPNGLNTVLGDDGVRLSGGQRQRVAIARALLKDAELLILDEATSDLDSAIEDCVHGAIEELERNYITLVIAHRLSTVVNADRIFALEDGQISEAGVHSELVDGGGIYAELYRRQTDEV